jgi:putative transposase
MSRSRSPSGWLRPALTPRWDQWAYDNALAESVIGLFKTELITPGGPWRIAEQVEAATLHYVYWFNHHRLLEINGDLPPIGLEQAHYRRHNSDLAEAG